jgi:hypothetical protein
MNPKWKAASSAGIDDFTVEEFLYHVTLDLDPPYL